MPTRDIFDSPNFISSVPVEMSEYSDAHQTPRLAHMPAEVRRAPPALPICNSPRLASWVVPLLVIQNFVEFAGLPVIRQTPTPALVACRYQQLEGQQLPDLLGAVLAPGAVVVDKCLKGLTHG